MFVADEQYNRKVNTLKVGSSLPMNTIGTSLIHILTNVFQHFIYTGRDGLDL